MTKTEPLAPGDTVQYRKVGQARLVEYRGYSRYQTSEVSEGWWTVEWIKAPKKYREECGAASDSMFWFAPKDRL